MTSLSTIVHQARDQAGQRSPPFPRARRARRTLSGDQSRSKSDAVRPRPRLKSVPHGSRKSPGSRTLLRPAADQKFPRAHDRDRKLELWQRLALDRQTTGALVEDCGRKIRSHGVELRACHPRCEQNGSCSRMTRAICATSSGVFPWPTMTSGNPLRRCRSRSTRANPRSTNAASLDMAVAARDPL